MAEPLPRPEPTGFSALPPIHTNTTTDEKEEEESLSHAVVGISSSRSKESCETVVVLKEEKGELSEKVKVLKKKIEKGGEEGRGGEEEAGEEEDEKLREHW